MASDNAKGTTFQLVNVLDSIIISSNLKRKTAAILLNAEKAFNKVWYPGLIFKLIALGIPTQLIKIIKSFLLNRTLFVKINESFFSVKNIDADIPQGSCLSPRLFTLYNNDLHLTQSTKKAIFVDDVLFDVTCKSNALAINKLQIQINKMQPWYNQ